MTPQEQWFQDMAHECMLPGISRITPKSCETQRRDYCRFLKLKTYNFVKVVLECPKACPHWKKVAFDINQTAKFNNGYTRKIDMEKEIEIVALYKDGVTPNDISKRCGIPTVTVSMILYRHNQTLKNL